jgi:hypothetical protein
MSDFRVVTDTLNSHLLRRHTTVFRADVYVSGDTVVGRVLRLYIGPEIIDGLQLPTVKNAHLAKCENNVLNVNRKLKSLYRTMKSDLVCGATFSGQNCFGLGLIFEE